ncbi:MAG TPA: redoxin domain-containing protein [Phycisphaerae bacterium]|nr:redoxin domain-containing protein [Phycisphaerae bacterium]HRY69444.1 redoxin domain-containing protein [Phycisphaerae bacterium]HSA26311.1 redoxin domain-containing protein [Phycisphaerae bacterium]
MRSRSTLMVLILAAMPAASPVLGLDVGDPAPPLQITEWVAGKAVDLKAGKGKTVYVLEFWATWCGPCKMSIPHLTELQAKYKDKDVVIIGISDEPPGTIRPFMKNMGDKMVYTIASDKAGTTMRTYLGGFGVNGIPYACIVDKSSTIVWHGSPFEELDNTLEQVVTGKFDVEVAKRSAKAVKMLDTYFGTLIKASETSDTKDKDKLASDARKTGDEILKLADKNPKVLAILALNILLHPQLKIRDRELALKAASNAKDLAGGKDFAILDAYARVLWETGKRNEAVKHQKDAVALAKDPTIRQQLTATLKEYEQSLAGAQPATTRPAATPPTEDKPAK